VSVQALSAFHHAICRRAWEFASTLLDGSLPLEVYLTSQQGRVLGQWPRHKTALQIDR
jgi:hypothetical protein